MNALTSAGVGRARRRKTRSPPSGSRSPAQVRDLAAQLLDLLTLLARRQILALTLLGFGAPHVFAQRLRIEAQVPRHGRSGDRTRTQAVCRAPATPRDTSSLL